ncbi:hypothetical protein LTR67_002700 [Exophiala xenobiotica]
MPSPSRSLEPQTTSNILRQQLVALDREGRSLILKRTDLEEQLHFLQNRISENITNIQQKMEVLDRAMSAEEKAGQQLTFRHSVLRSDDVFDGLCARLKHDVALRIAVHAIANGRGSIDHHNKMAAALMTELAGDLSEAFEPIATRIQQLNKNDDNDDVAVPSVVDAPSASIRSSPSLRGRSAERPVKSQTVAPLKPLVPYRSPSIKSEDSSSQQSALTQVTTNMYAPATYTPNNTYAPANMFASASPAIQSGMNPPASSNGNGGVTKVAGADTNSMMSRLDKSYPGLLDSLTTPLTRKRPAPSPVARDSSPSTSEKGGTPVKTFKRHKITKEPIMAPAFTEFMQKLQSLHQHGKSIAKDIKCSKCQHLRRDVRVLACLHLYCHKCIVSLRNSAEKGDAVTGFRAFCIVPNCNASVAGKTSVVDPELIDFLGWYDTQTAALPTSAAELHVMKYSLDRTPDDEDVKAKKKAVEKAISDARIRGLLDPPVDLIKIAKLARKPY